MQRHHYSKTFVLSAVLVGAAVELATIPLFSHLSDIFGRKRVYLTGAVIAGLFAFPYFAVLTYGGAVLIFVAIVLSMIMHSMMYGPQAALIGESFPTHLRYGGAGLGYQLASVFAGGPAPLVATWLLHETGTPYSISDLHRRGRGHHGGLLPCPAGPFPCEHRRRDDLQPRPERGIR